MKPAARTPRLKTGSERSPVVGRRLFARRRRNVLQQIARLAVQMPANRLQRGETEAFDLHLFQQRQVLLGNAYGLGQILGFHFALDEKDVQVDFYGHGALSVQMNCLFSRARATPSCWMRAITITTAAMNKLSRLPLSMPKVISVSHRPEVDAHHD